MLRKNETKALLVVCTTDSMIWNFLVPHIKYWKQNGFEVDIACSKTGFYFDELYALGFTIYNIPFQRKPVRLENLQAYKELDRLVSKKLYAAVISQEPVGGVIGRIIGKKNKIKNIYTVHGFHFYKGAPLSKWLLFYPIERFLSRWTDTIITINEEDYQTAKKFNAKSVKMINGIGVDLDNYTNDLLNKNKIRKRINISEDAYVILTVAEMIPRKNYETALRVIKEVSKNNRIHYLICGDGILSIELKNLTKKLEIEDFVHFLGFRKDVSDIYHAADLFFFPSFQEGLSIALIEAMASGLPIVCSDIRGNRDLIKKNKGGFLCEPTNASKFVEFINFCLNNSTKAYVDFNLQEVKKYSVNIAVEKFFKIIDETVNSFEE